jgi:hypothetical protein
VCGHLPTIDASGAREIHGTCWQSWWVDCSHCERAVAIEFDGDRPDEGRRAEAAARAAWNALVQLAA